jgi:hypothetical protein
VKLKRKRSGLYRWYKEPRKKEEQAAKESPKAKKKRAKGKRLSSRETD